MKPRWRSKQNTVFFEGEVIATCENDNRTDQEMNNAAACIAAACNLQDRLERTVGEEMASRAGTLGAIVRDALEGRTEVSASMMGTLIEPFLAEIGRLLGQEARILFLASGPVVKDGEQNHLLLSDMDPDELRKSASYLEQASKRAPMAVKGGTNDNDKPNLH